MKNSINPHRRPRSVGWIKILAAILVGVAAPSGGAEAEFPPLTTASGNPRLPGKFIWADLVTDDGPAAMNFYAQMFGWRFWPKGQYYVAINDSHPMAGVFQKARPANDPKAKPRWFGYISVSDVKKAERAVTEGGGKVLAPRQNFPKRGEQAVFADPEGALFGVMKTSSGDPEDFLSSTGDWVWIQLLSRDARRAGEFYRDVAGYEVIENTNPGRLNDYVLTSEGYARATVRNLTPQGGGVSPTWLPYVRVANVKETVTKATQLRGSVLIEPRPELFEGKVAVIADPTGAAIGVLEWGPEMFKGGK